MAEVHRRRGRCSPELSLSASIPANAARTSAAKTNAYSNRSGPMASKRLMGATPCVDGDQDGTGSVAAIAKRQQSGKWRTTYQENPEGNNIPGPPPASQPVNALHISGECQRLAAVRHHGLKHQGTTNPHQDGQVVYGIGEHFASCSRGLPDRVETGRHDLHQSPWNQQPCDGSGHEVGEQCNPNAIALVRSGGEESRTGLGHRGHKALPFLAPPSLYRLSSDSTPSCW
jgi:hypothetical protein